MIRKVFDGAFLSDYVLVLVQSLVTLAATKYRMKCTQRRDAASANNSGAVPPICEASFALGNNTPETPTH